MKKMQVFLQGEGISKTKLVEIPPDGTIQAVIEAASEHGLPLEPNETAVVMLEDSDDTIESNVNIQDTAIKHRCHIHVHRCRKVTVTVRFNGVQHERPFPPSATIKRITRWATRKFGLDDVDAPDHALQICNTQDRPEETVHVGTLVQHPHCQICFDLVPKQRVEG